MLNTEAVFIYVSFFKIPAHRNHFSPQKFYVFMQLNMNFVWNMHSGVVFRKFYIYHDSEKLQRI